MKRLLVLRHGKSNWKADFDSDWHRPINKRGRKAAEFMGAFAREKGLLPDTALTSSAIRCQQTLERFLGACSDSCPKHIDDDFYLSGARPIWDSVSALDDVYETVLICKHQPTCSDLIELLTAEYDEFPTAALAVIHCSQEHWGDIEFGINTLISVFIPRELMA